MTTQKSKKHLSERFFKINTENITKERDQTIKLYKQYKDEEEEFEVTDIDAEKEYLDGYYKDVDLLLRSSDFQTPTA